MVLVVLVLFQYFRHSTEEEFSAGDATMTVAVMGGTGSQGKGVIDALLASTGTNRKIEIRTMTRNNSSLEAKALMARGVQVLSGSVGDERALARFMDGVTHVFAVTFSDFEQGRELASGKLLAKVIERTDSVSSVVFSGGQRTGIDVLDTKSKIEDEMRTVFASQRSLSHLRRVLFLHSSFFYENLLTKVGTKRVFSLDDGSVLFKAPLPKDISIPMVSSYDIGRAAAYAFLHPEELEPYSRIDSTTVQNGALTVPPIRLVGQVADGDTFVKHFSALTGKVARYEPSGASRETLAKQLPPKEAAALELMYQWFEKMAHQAIEGEADMTLCRQVFPDIVRNVSEWMKEGKSKILDLINNNNNNTK